MPALLESRCGIAGQNGHRLATLALFMLAELLDVGEFNEPHSNTQYNAEDKVRAALEHNPSVAHMMIFANDIMTYVETPAGEWQALRKSETPEGVAVNLAAMSSHFRSIGHSAVHVPDNQHSEPHDVLLPMQCEFQIKHEKIAYLQTAAGRQDYIHTYAALFPDKPDSYLKVSGFCTLTLFAMGFLTHIDGQDVSQMTEDELYPLIFDVAYMLLGTFSPYALQKLVMYAQPETRSAAALNHVFAKINPYPTPGIPNSPFITKLRELAHSAVELYKKNKTAQRNSAPTFR